jgi:hypothetical protein
MSRAYRRYEILLPLRFNDRQPVPDDLVTATLRELENQFPSESRVTYGRYRQGVPTDRDDLVRVFVDVPDTAASREFFAGYKEQLKTRFRQLDIGLTTYPIEVVGLGTL